MKTIVIYHANCVDGFTAAWLFSRVYTDAVFIAAQYGDDPPGCLKGNKVFIVDFSYPREVMERINDQASSLVVLDHHKSAEVHLDGLSYCQFNKDECGASLALNHLRDSMGEHFVPDDMVTMFVGYVRDHDLWIKEKPDTEAVRLYFRTKKFEFSEWTALCDEGVDAWIAKGRSILEYHKSLVNSHVEKAREVKLAGQTVLGVPCTCGPLISDIGHELAKRAVSQIGCCWFETKASERVYSLRSTGDASALEIAQHYGGGGHRHACGFTIPVPS